MKFIAIILILVPSIFLHTDLGNCMNEIQTYVVTQKDDGKEITVPCGGVVQIELEGLGGAGYKWYADAADSEHVKFLSEETKRISDEKKVGAPVMEMFRFKAVKEGSAEIRMDLYRVWEGKGSAIKHFKIELNIQQDKKGG